ncbi:sulfate adenylyltransferase subunit CysN [Pendulispora albinea]|uniref:Sulfate adenylyltransferase subunit 1 n=1 Tax=Pendulispora albinea TaxID=2741071 RepID=A0ABZ2M6H7_9BACT
MSHANHATDLLRFSTAGSVDDGKSTLIGRLLYDSKSIFEDQYAAIQRTTARRGGAAADLALLTDGLIAEREQGITIDVAYRYFATPKRKFIIADTPGHEQYTRNMVTGASTAMLTIILVDARKGASVQSRRHAAIAALLGIPHIVVAVNKMDLVGYSKSSFDAVEAQFSTFAKALELPHLHYVPMSALHGDMVVERGDNLPWYTGPTLLGLLENLPVERDIDLAPFRFPVQLVSRPQTREHHDFRGYMGRIESGSIRIGDAVTILPQGRNSRVKGILTYDGALREAFAPQSITLMLEDEIDISRGDMIVKSESSSGVLDRTHRVQVAREARATVCWMGDAPLDPRRKYLMKHTTRTVHARVEGIDHRLDVNTLTRQSAAELKMNDIGQVRFKLQNPLAFDAYQVNRATGAFILIDSTTNNTVGAGMLLSAPAA